MKPANPLFSFFSLKQIIEEAGEIPLLEFLPSFDWHRFSSLTASRFGVPRLSIEPGHQQIRSPTELKEGLGNAVLTFPIDMAPLGGHAYWMMARKDVAKFTSWMLNGKGKTKALTSEILTEGFYRYLLLEIMDAALDLEPLRSLTPILHEEAPLPEESAFCIDIQIEFDQSACSGRLAISETLRKSWNRHFHRKGLNLSSPQAQNLELTLSIQKGSVELMPSEWAKVKKGDFIVLDRDSSHAALSIGAKPLFQIKIEQNKIHLLDYARVHKKRDLMKETTETLEEIPVEIVVELARIQMPLQKLTELTAGNTLELPIEPDGPVALTVNGRKIGDGELVMLGETLGVRILK